MGKAEDAMKISSADLRTLERAANVAAAQEELMKSKGDDPSSSRLQAEAAIAAAIAVLALGSILGLSLVAQPPDNGVDGNQIVSFDLGTRAPNRL
jgi:hypothetical protein